MAPRNVLFDLDGTLTDSREGIIRSLQEALVRVGREPPAFESLAWVIGPDIRRSIGTLLETDDRELVEHTLELYRERYGSVGLFENRVYDGVEEALAELVVTGATLVVATAKPLVYAERIVAHFGLDRWFDDVFGPALDGTHSAKPELLRHILDARGFRRQETAMVGDRRQDVEGAVAVGIPCVGVAYGYGDERELAHAAVVCDSPAEIPAALNRLGHAFRRG